MFLIYGAATVQYIFFMLELAVVPSPRFLLVLRVNLICMVFCNSTLGPVEGFCFSSLV